MAKIYDFNAELVKRKQNPIVTVCSGTDTCDIRFWDLMAAAYADMSPKTFLASLKKDT